MRSLGLSQFGREGVDAELTDARALRRGEEGVLASIGAEHGHGMKDRDGGRRRLLDRKKKGNGEGSTRAVSHGGRRGAGAVAPCGGGHVGGLAGDGVRTGSTRGQSVAAGAGQCRDAWEQGNGAVRVGCV
jgi:hypothetical protein